MKFLIIELAITLGLMGCSRSPDFTDHYGKTCQLYNTYKEVYRDENDIVSIGSVCPADR